MFKRLILTALAAALILPAALAGPDQETASKKKKKDKNECYFYCPSEDVQIVLAFNYLNDVRADPTAYCPEIRIRHLEKVEPSQPLIWNTKLAEVAQHKAEDMAKYKYISHADRFGHFVDFWLRKFKYKYGGCTESLAAGDDMDGEFAIALLLHDRGMPNWFRSSGHRRNLLGIGNVPHACDEVGIGHAVSKNGLHYWVVTTGTRTMIATHYSRLRSYIRVMFGKYS